MKFKDCATYQTTNLEEGNILKGLGFDYDEKELKKNNIYILNGHRIISS